MQGVLQFQHGCLAAGGSFLEEPWTSLGSTKEDSEYLRLLFGYLATLNSSLYNRLDERHLEDALSPRAPISPLF